jgi:hypothetical protein
MGAANGAKPGRNGAQSAVRTRFQQSVPASTPFVPRRGESYELGPPVRQRALAERFRTVCYGSAPGSRLATPAVGATLKLDATRGQLKARRGHPETADRQWHALAAPRCPPPASCGAICVPRSARRDLRAAICAPRSARRAPARGEPLAAGREQRAASCALRGSAAASSCQLPASSFQLRVPRSASREARAASWQLPASTFQLRRCPVTPPGFAYLRSVICAGPRAASRELRATSCEPRDARREPRVTSREPRRVAENGITGSQRPRRREPEAGSRKLEAGNSELGTGR